MNKVFRFPTVRCLLPIVYLGRLGVPFLDIINPEEDAIALLDDSFFYL